MVIKTISYFEKATITEIYDSNLEKNVIEYSEAQTVHYGGIKVVRELISEEGKSLCLNNGALVHIKAKQKQI